MRYSKEERTMFLEDWKQSGKSAWKYAKENRVSWKTFKSWTENATETKPCFVEVPAQIMKPPLRTPEILIEKGDVKIRIPLAISGGELRAVMEGLEPLVRRAAL